MDDSDQIKPSIPPQPSPPPSNLGSTKPSSVPQETPNLSTTPSTTISPGLKTSPLTTGQPRPTTETPSEALEKKAEKMVDELDKEEEKLKQLREEESKQTIKPPTSLPEENEAPLSESGAEKKVNKKVVLGGIVLMLIAAVAVGVLIISSKVQLANLDIRQQAYPEEIEPVCGDGTCDEEEGETTESCPTDCPPTPPTDSGGGGLCADGSPGSFCMECDCPSGCTYLNNCCPDGTHLCDPSGSGGGGTRCNLPECRSNCKQVSCNTTPSPCGQVDVYDESGLYCGQVGSQCTNGTNPCGGGGDGGDSGPTQKLICNSMSKDIATPAVGDTVTFTCSASAETVEINSYQFRYSIDGRTAVRFDATNSRAVASFTVEQAGSYLVQCRACTANNTCTPWEAASP